LKKTINSRVESIGKLEKENSNMQDIIKQNGQKLIELATTMETREVEMRKMMETEKSNMLATVKEKEDRIHSLEKEVTGLHSNIDELKREVQHGTFEISALQKTLTRKDEIISELEKEKLNLENKLDTLNSEFAQAKLQSLSIIENKSEMAEEFKKELDKMKGTMTELRQSKESVETDNKKLNDEIAKKILI